MGFEIYEVVYHNEYPDVAFADLPSGAVVPDLSTFVKMILVQRKPGEFCEIYNEQGMNRGVLRFYDPFIVSVDSQSVLVTRDPVNGTCGCYQEAYWAFDKDGPVFLDMNIIDETEKALVPQGFSLNYHANHGFNIEALTYSADYYSNDGRSGSLTMRFALKDHKLVVVDKKFVLYEA